MTQIKRSKIRLRAKMRFTAKCLTKLVLNNELVNERVGLKKDIIPNYLIVKR